MKHSPLVGVLLVALCGCQAQPPSRELEKLVQDKLNALKEVTAALKTVTDTKTAQAALVKMDAHVERLIECDEVLLDPRYVKQMQKDKLAEKFDQPMVDALAALKTEVHRVVGTPEAMKILEQNETWKRWQSDWVAVMEGSKVMRARLGVQALEKATVTWKTKYGQWPESLEMLSIPGPDKGAALVTAEALKDPWGRPYQYQPFNLEPKTSLPFIYSTGPNPKDEAGYVANWQGRPGPNYGKETFSTKKAGL